MMNHVRGTYSGVIEPNDLNSLVSDINENYKTE